MVFAHVVKLSKLVDIYNLYFEWGMNKPSRYSKKWTCPVVNGFALSSRHWWILVWSHLKIIISFYNL